MISISAKSLVFQSNMGLADFQFLELPSSQLLPVEIVTEL